MTVKELRGKLLKIENQESEVKIWDREKIEYVSIFSVNPSRLDDTVLIEGVFCGKKDPK
mgnify:CR=1 FL=1